MIGATVNSSPRLLPPGCEILVAAMFCLSLAGRTARADDIAAQGGEKQPNSVMFIFDCSASTVERDFPHGNGAMMRRLDGARDALIDVFKHPGLRKFRDVGLRVYGRRFGQDKNGQVRLSKFANIERREALAAGLPFTEVHPGADVELVFPIQLLTEQRREEMIITLGSLESWGFTPLYLAISDAVNDPLRKGERRRIVAITDGFNEQGNVGVLNQVTAQALGAQLTAHPQVTLDIIGFGNQLVPGARANAQELADMKGLAGGHGGVFYQAANSDDLLNGILKSLGLEKRKP